MYSTVVNLLFFPCRERPASEKLVLADEAPAPATAGEKVTTPPFIKAAVYSGQKPGYAFKMGDMGLGYYVEAPQAKK